MSMIRCMHMYVYEYMHAHMSDKYENSYVYICT